ncbi:MAG: hypothetical protein SFU27_04665 [Thermonemataceae bacterium]|nr:hypothetical protein [Thermonemataceae bacterium]
MGLLDFKNTLQQVKKDLLDKPKEALLEQKAKILNQEREEQDNSDKYAKAIKEGWIVYSCNCGWLDKSHIGINNKNKLITPQNQYVGAINLWKQIKEEIGFKSKYRDGFRIIYSQESSITSFTPNVGVTKKYFIPSGLSLLKKEAIALSIFQEVSLEFEELQANGVIIGRGDSSFEPADLVSNILGFYLAVDNNLSIDKLFRLAKTLTPEQSLEIYNKYPDTFTSQKYKNRKFSPIYFENLFCSVPKFPQEFQRIVPSVKGKDFDEWIDLFDIYEGRPPLIIPKE